MTNYSIGGSSGTTGLSELTAPASGDKIPVVDVSDTSTAPAGSAGSDKFVKLSTLATFFGGGGGGVVDWFSVASYGGLPSASASTNTTAFQDAWNDAKAAGGGRIYIPHGIYDLNCSSGGIGGDVAGTAIFWQGDGKDNTRLRGHGSGVLFHMADSTLWSSKTVNGGGILGVTLDGTSTTGKTDGFLLDSINLFEFDLGIANFIDTTTSIGFHMNNSFAWSENLRGNISADNCANAFVFESTTNTSGNATGSFERSILVLGCQQHGNGNGLVLRNGADGLGSVITYMGNFQTGSGTWSSISIDGTSDLTGQIFIEIENDGPPDGSGFTHLPTTIAGTGFLGGNINASWDSVPDGWTASTLTSAFLTGIVGGDTNLQALTATNMNYYLAHSGTFNG